MRTIRSQDVAEMLGKRHDNLLRAIRKYIVTLGEDAGNYFIEEGSGRKAYFKVTLAGCELLGGRMIGKAGDEFKSWYRAAFEVGNEAVREPKQEEKKVTVKEFAVSEVAEMLGMSERSVYRNIQSGKLEAVEREVMVPTVKKFITEEALEEFRAKREVS